MDTVEALFCTFIYPALRTKPSTASTGEDAQLFGNSSMELNTESIATDDSREASEELGGQQPLSPTASPASAEMPSPVHADFLKNTEKNKESELETPEDITKQVSFKLDYHDTSFPLCTCIAAGGGEERGRIMKGYILVNVFIGRGGINKGFIEVRRGGRGN